MTEKVPEEHHAGEMLEKSHRGGGAHKQHLLGFSDPSGKHRQVHFGATNEFIGLLYRT